MEWPPDVRERVAHDFRGRETEACDILRDCGPARERARALRCVIHLAGGDLMKLREFTRVAEMDFRDVVAWAEYDGERRVRDLSLPFGQADVPPG